MSGRTPSSGQVLRPVIAAETRPGHRRIQLAVGQLLAIIFTTPTAVMWVSIPSMVPTSVLGPLFQPKIFILSAHWHYYTAPGSNCISCRRKSKADFIFNANGANSLDSKLIMAVHPTGLVGSRRDYSSHSSGSGNVGIGTTTPQGALVVTNGNVGIGTWVPTGLFQINKPSASPFVVTTAGNVGIGTITPQTRLAITNGNVGIGTWTAGGGSPIVATGNVGIGSLTPGVKLDVFGTVP